MFFHYKKIHSQLRRVLHELNKQPVLQNNSLTPTKYRHNGSILLSLFTNKKNTPNFLNMKISAKLNTVKISRSDILLLTAAFVAYTGMYAVRKSFLAGQFADVTLTHDFHFKTLLVISQVVGYMLSKFIGIKLVSGVSEKNRYFMLIGLVAFGLLMLLVFALAPLPLKPIALFLNGLPLGMVFGLVLTYLEGRRNSELLVAGLSATFIFSTGFVKTTALWISSTFSISEMYMPFYTGLLFFPLFIVAVWFLKMAKKPSAEDELLRTKRAPMNKASRKDFLVKHGWIFIALVIIYVVLTIVRDFRDNFMVEFWTELGHANSAELLTYSETPIALFVLIAAALGIIIKSNTSALKFGLYSTLGSAAILILSSLFFYFQWLSPMSWMIVTGAAIYLPYILFHCLIFERLLAFLRYTGTVSYLFYVADAFGYLGSVSILLVKEFIPMHLSFSKFFTYLTMFAGVAAVLLCVFAFATLKQKNKKINLALVN